jgi:hypothetical protein
MLDSGVIADFVLYSPDKIVGFEIKSIRDSFNRLATQLPAYLAMFHATYLVVEEHEKRLDALLSISSRPGILLIREHGVEVLRPARARAYLEKKNSAAWLRRKDMPARLNKLDITTAREKLISLQTRESLNALAMLSVQRRLRAPHDALVSDIGLTADSDDLSNLNSRAFKISVE